MGAACADSPAPGPGGRGPTMSLQISRIGVPQPGDRTPYNAFVALPGSVHHGPEEALPGRRDLVGFLLRQDPMHPVIRLHIGHEDAWSLEVVTSQGTSVRAFDDPDVQHAWRRGRLSDPRGVLMALGRDFPDLFQSTMALVVVRDPEAQRSLGLGFAVDSPDLGDVLWDLDGYDVERLEDALIRRYGGQEAREAGTLERQRLYRLRESELPIPTTSLQATRLALEWAIGATIREAHLLACPGDILDSLTGELRTIVEANLDLLWDADEGRATDFDVQHLHRWLPGYT